MEEITTLPVTKARGTTAKEESAGSPRMLQMPTNSRFNNSGFEPVADAVANAAAMAARVVALVGTTATSNA